MRPNWWILGVVLWFMAVILWTYLSARAWRSNSPALSPRMEGRRLALRYMVLGPIVAGSIFGVILLFDLISGAEWSVVPDFVEDIVLYPGVALGVLSLVALSWWLGGITGVQILEKGREGPIVGVVFSMGALLLAALGGACFGFAAALGQQSTIGGELGAVAFDYLFKPVYWVGLVGFLPASTVGAVLGGHLERKRTDPLDASRAGQ